MRLEADLQNWGSGIGVNNGGMMNMDMMHVCEGEDKLEFERIARRVQTYDLTIRTNQRGGQLSADIERHRPIVLRHCIQLAKKQVRQRRSIALDS